MYYLGGFLSGSDNRESTCITGDLGLIPGWGRSPGEGNGNPLQCSCLENFMDRGAWQATVPGGPSANAGDVRDMGLILGSGRSPGGRNGSPLQYSCPENPMEKGAWRATVHWIKKSRTQLSDLARTFTLCRQVQWTAVLEYQYQRPS